MEKARARLREAASGVLKESAIAEALERRDLLERREDGYRRYVRYIPKIGKIEAYALKRSEFGRTGLARDRDAFQVYEGGLATDTE